MTNLAELRRLHAAASTSSPWEYHTLSPAGGTTQARVRIHWQGPYWWPNGPPDYGVHWMDCPTLSVWGSREYAYSSCGDEDCEGCSTCEEIADPRMAECYRKEKANLALAAAAVNALPWLLAAADERDRYKRMVEAGLKVTGCGCGDGYCKENVQGIEEVQSAMRAAGVGRNDDQA